MALKRPTVFLTLVLLLSGCAHYPVNAPLPAGYSYTGYRFQNVAPQTNSDDLALMLAFSGGGTRAAALSYSVLEELKKTQVGPRGNQHPLLDDVGLISSVSGGSFTAACYALWGDRFFSDFEPLFLKKHVQTGLLLRTLAPWNQVRLASPAFSRSDLAAEYYDHLLFKGATFADLKAQAGRPFLSVNATDLGSGARFEFTQDEFDLLHSDLSRFSLSRAVAASSAFPVYLTPIVLKNYSAEQPEPEPEWTRAILEDPAASSRLKHLALEARSYSDGSRRFIHLLDGGLSDNLGLRGALDRAMAREQSFRVPSVPMQIPRRIAIIVVDAHTDRDYGWYSKEHSLGLGALLGSVGQVSVSHYSFETIELFREAMARLSRARDASRFQTAESDPVEIATYTIELRFNQLADESDRRFFNSVPTRLQLPPSTVDRLKYLAAVELRKNPEFHRLIQDLDHADEMPAPKVSFTQAARGGSLPQHATQAMEPNSTKRLNATTSKDNVGYLPAGHRINY
jgi:NTE family protein